MLLGILMQHIHVEDHCIPAELLAEVQRTINNLRWQYGWRSNSARKAQPGHWNFPILSAGMKNTEDVSASLQELPAPLAIVNTLWEWLRENKFEGKADLLRCYANAHTYGVEGYPHQDSQRRDEFTSVLYTNTVWHRDWGGATEIWDEAGWDIVRAIMPHVGRLATFPSWNLHRAAAVTRICPAARHTLIFKVRPL